MYTCVSLTNDSINEVEQLRKESIKWNERMNQEVSLISKTDEAFNAAEKTVVTSWVRKIRPSVVVVSVAEPANDLPKTFLRQLFWKYIQQNGIRKLYE